MEAIRSLLTLVMEYATTPMPSLIASTSVPNVSPAGRYSFINNSLSNVVPTETLRLVPVRVPNPGPADYTSGCPRRQTTSFLFFSHIISYFRPSSSVRSEPWHLHCNPCGASPLTWPSSYSQYASKSLVQRPAHSIWRRGTRFSTVFPRFSTELPDLRTELWSD
jgi:hypothetical protein